MSIMQHQTLERKRKVMPCGSRAFLCCIVQYVKIYIKVQPGLHTQPPTPSAIPNDRPYLSMK
jgi:hypothetical protein